MAAPIQLGNPLMPGAVPTEFLTEGMRQWFLLEAEKPTPYVGEVFNIRSTKKASEFEWSMVGFGLHSQVTPGTTPAVAQRAKAYKSIFTVQDYALQADTQKNTIEDDLYGWASLKSNSEGLAKSAKRTKVIHAVAALEAGFTTTWNTTEAANFFSASHPLAPNAATPPPPHTAGFFSNLVSAGLTIAGVQEGLIKLQNCPDAMGEPWDLTEDGVTLIVSTQQQFLADQIINSPGLYNSPNLSKNTLQGKLDILVIPKLTSSTNWYLRAAMSNTKGFWFERELPSTEEDYTIKTRMYTQVSYMRYSFGFSDPRGWIGGTP